MVVAVPVATCLLDASIGRSKPRNLARGLGPVYCGLRGVNSHADDCRSLCWTTHPTANDKFAPFPLLLLWPSSNLHSVNGSFEARSCMAVTRNPRQVPSTVTTRFLLPSLGLRASRARPLRRRDPPHRLSRHLRPTLCHHLARQHERRSWTPWRGDADLRKE